MREAEMAWRHIALAILVSVSSGWSASWSQSPGAGSFSQKHLAYFLEESTCKYRGRTWHSTYSIEDLLCDVAGTHTSVQEIIEAYAKALTVPVPTARTYAELIVQSLELDRDCDWRCPLDMDSKFVARLKKVGLEDPTGELLLAVSRNLTNITNLDELVALLSRHPQSQKILQHLFEYSWDLPYLIPGILSGDDPSVYEFLVIDRFSDFHEQDLLALLTYGRNVARSPDVRLKADVALMTQLAGLGFDDTALEIFNSLSDSERVTVLRDDFYLSHEDSSFSGQSRFRLGIAAILIAANRSDEALPFIDSFLSSNQDRDETATQVALFLKEVVHPVIAREDAFDLFLFGSRRGADPAPSDDIFSRNGIAGWSSAIRAASPATKHLAKAYLTSLGLTDLANFSSEERYYSSGLEFGINVAVFGLEDTTFEELRDRFATRLAERKFRLEAGRNSVTVAELPNERPIAFSEHELSSLSRPRRAHPLSSGELEELGFPSYAVIRSDRLGDEIRIIYSSHVLDPVGEVSGGGYWIARSDDGGATMKAPIYLGIQEYFPYRVSAESRLSLFADGLLRLEVVLEEVDRASITFPPVGLRASRSQDGLYLDFEMEALLRDSDGDGMTDLAEHRMGLDYHNRDSDGDGAADGLDSLPTIKFNPTARGYRLGLTLMEHLFGFERGALIVGAPPSVQPRDGESIEHMFARALGKPVGPIGAEHTMFSKGDPALFESLALPFRLIVQDDAVSAALAAEYGVHYPAGILWNFKDPYSERWIIIWSASWTGGTLKIEIDDQGEYQVDVLSEWIT